MSISVTVGKLKSVNRSIENIINDIQSGKSFRDIDFDWRLLTELASARENFTLASFQEYLEEEKLKKSLKEKRIADAG